jgi:hypothetical protein
MQHPSTGTSPVPPFLPATPVGEIDQCRKIGDGNSAARITSGIDHHAFLKPVSSAG